MSATKEDISRTVSNYQKYKTRLAELPRVWLVENTEDGIVYGAYDSKESAEIEFNHRKRSGERRIALRSYKVQDKETALLAGWKEQ